MSDKEFDDFLSQASEQDARERELEAYYRQLRQRLDVAILVHKLPRVIDADPEHQAVLQQDAVRQFEEVLRDLYRMHETKFDSQASEDAFVTLRAKHFVALQALKQASWLEGAMRLIAAHDFEQQQAPAGVTIEPNSEAKKRFIAYLLIGDQLEPGHPWITFMNNVIPGETFDPQSQDAEQYLVEALIAHTSLDEADQERDGHFADACRIANIDETASVYPQRQVQAITQLILKGIATHKLRDSEGVHAIAQRQADLYEICRGVFEQTTIVALITYIDRVYPLAD
jgi:hypothetical protein